MCGFNLSRDHPLARSSPYKYQSEEKDSPYPPVSRPLPYSQRITAKLYNSEGFHYAANPTESIDKLDLRRTFFLVGDSMPFLLPR